MAIEKSANQLWRESGTTLPFKEWINREKAKYVNFNGEGQEPPVLMVNKPLNDAIKNALDEVKKSAGYVDKPANKTVFGINKYVLIVAGVAIVAVVAYSVIKKRGK